MLGRPPCQPAARLQLPRRALHHGWRCSASADAPGWAWISPDEGKPLLDTSDALLLDARTAREFDAEHVTKPPRKALSAPLGPGFGAAAAARLGRPQTRAVLLVTRAGGDEAAAAAEQLSSLGYSAVLAVEGGWAAWRRLWTPSGRPTPPPGRWVPTGPEALKSGLNVGSACEQASGGVGSPLAAGLTGRSHSLTLSRSGGRELRGAAERRRCDALQVRAASRR